MSEPNSTPRARPFALTGRVALVTGGGRDIGGAIALALGSAGADVLITYLKSAEVAASTTESLRAMGVRAQAVQCDVRDKDQLDGLVATALEFGGGRVDVLVNNAGGDIRRVNLKTVDADLIAETFALNFTSALLLTQSLVPHMVANGFGRVIYLGSIAAANGGGGAHHYAAAKAAVTSLSRSLAQELGSAGITFNTLAPGFVDNGFHVDTPREVVEMVTKMIPLGRTGTNDDIGAAAVFLASDEAAWITGDVLNVNGGMYFGG